MTFSTRYFARPRHILTSQSPPLGPLGALGPLRALALVALVASAAVGCYGSDLEGSAPDAVIPTDTSDTADGTTPNDGTTPTDGVDDTEVTSPDVADTSDTADTSGPPPIWEASSLGDIGGISDLVAVRDDLAYAVSGTRVLRWNGATWAAYGEPGGDKVLHGVWATAPDGEVAGEVIVVGDEGLVARRPDGAAWSVVDVGTTSDLWDVDGRASNDVFVVGDLGQVRHWDGDAWAERFAKSTLDLRSMLVERTTTGDEGVYAVGTGGQLVTFDQGAFKATQIAGGTVVLSDIIKTSEGTLIAVGSGHTITARRTVDPTWKGQASNDGGQRDVHALAMTADDKVWAFGDGGLVLQQTGTVWATVQAAQTSAGLKSFAAAAVLPGNTPRLLVLAGEGGGVRLDGATWSSLATRPEAGVKDLEMAPDGTLWAAGSLGLLVSRGADGWSAEAMPDGIATANLEAVTITPSGVVYAVGASGTIVKKVDGSPVERITSPVPLDLFGVASNASGVIACGRGGTLVVIGSDDVTSIRASGSVADLRAIAYGGDGALWVVGAFGTLLRADGAGLPLPLLSGVGGSLNDVTATSGGVFAAGDNGVILRADGDGVTLLAETPGVFLHGIAAHEGKHFAAGWNGTIIHDEGDAWESEPTGTNLILEAIWVGADEALAAGRQGALLRRLEAP